MRKVYESDRRIWAKQLLSYRVSLLKCDRHQRIFLICRSLASSTLVAILSSCSFQPDSVTLSSGTAGGFYNRVGEQISNSTKTTVGLKVSNLDSQGSYENLQRLLERKVDFALVQLDVASEAMRQGKVQAVAILANEYLQMITRKDSGLQVFADLQGKRVATGTPGSGIRFTTSQLIKADKLQIQEDAADFERAFQKLNTRQIDAIAYVGSVGASQKLRQQFINDPNLKIIPIQKSLINNLTILDPGSYQSATLPMGTYTSRPPIPEQEISTISTATVLVTRPDMDKNKVGLVTWSIISTARTYSQFYPELQTTEASESLRKGLFYIHPAAQKVFEEGDPRAAFIRYWQSNSDLQAGVFILVSTSVVGLLIGQWRKQSSQKLLATTVNRINELKNLLTENPQEALKGIEDLRQEHRLRFIDGAVTTEIYEQLQHKTHIFADECRLILERQRKKFVMDTLLLLDEWQATLQTDPDVALQKLGQIKQDYRDMLLSDQVDIEAYVELMQLTLMSVMTLMPKSSQG
ncbi:TAXI family TRAP transporter solute-binding subunit [Nostocaceae cyanobacterium CENA369]|uniref:TAXI family TRAP transporter solute-binding subunit n=1 Tax=Dendronalium phyllosphericum CENA369 TaxID=1725256 RepID=A0A8J7I6A4_9NOST|nr:TAXI family TRAP transporter solute-binding subunit [Dendronalium phyllosphericum]MBH8575695.1 TAXI family TRAP transporter solute-binding subunit [Dendronalium phyllosphericum CENA369]